jgi:hypothetical protein
VKVPCTPGWNLEVLASRKAAWGDPYAEGSETANSGTDEQERHRRPDNPDKATRPANVQSRKWTNDCQVDAAAIGGRKMLLPGEISVSFCNVNGEVSRGHSSQGNEPIQITGWTHGNNEGLNKHRSGIRQGKTGNHPFHRRQTPLVG